jgi:phosphopantetheinyl transferase
MEDSTIDDLVASPANGANAPSAEFRAQSCVDHRYCASRAFDVASQRRAESWLSERERTEFAAWREPRRRNAWLLARMLGKQLIAENLFEMHDPTSIEILSRNSEGQSVRPRAWCGGVEQPWSLSISHTERGVLAAVCAAERSSVGVDMTDCDNVSDGFIRLWFTPAEQSWLRETDCRTTACFIWAAKEALYKACNDGEGFAPRDIEVLPHERYTYRQMPLTDCELKSWTIDGQLAVMAMVGTRLEHE